MRDKTCCFTGHRKIATEFLEPLRFYLKQEVISLVKQGYIHFGIDGALGFDTEAALTVLEVKKLYPKINLILVLPCKTQTYNWAKNDINTYNEIMTKSDKVTYISETYFSGCMHKRNRHLVDHSSVCITYLVKKKGGTAYTVDYAMSKNLRVINLGNLIKRKVEL